MYSSDYLGSIALRSGDCKKFFRRCGELSNGLGRFPAWGLAIGPCWWAIVDRPAGGEVSAIGFVDWKMGVVYAMGEIASGVVEDGGRWVGIGRHSHAEFEDAIAVGFVGLTEAMDVFDMEEFEVVKGPPKSWVVPKGKGNWVHGMGWAIGHVVFAPSTEFGAEELGGFKDHLAKAKIIEGDRCWRRMGIGGE